LPRDLLGLHLASWASSAASEIPLASVATRTTGERTPAVLNIDPQPLSARSRRTARRYSSLALLPVWLDGALVLPRRCVTPRQVRWRRPLALLVERRRCRCGTTAARASRAAAARRSAPVGAPALQRHDTSIARKCRACSETVLPPARSIRRRLSSRSRRTASSLAAPGFVDDHIRCHPDIVSPIDVLPTRGLDLDASSSYRVLMPSEPIREVTVLGAGVMGAAIAAHLANAGLRVACSTSRQGRPRRRPARAQQDRRRRPGGRAQGEAGGVLLAALRHAGHRRQPGRRPRRAVAASDVVIEAIIENLAIKQALYSPHRRDGRARRHHLEHVGPAHRRPDAGPQRRLPRPLLHHALLQPAPLPEAGRDRRGADTKPETIARAEALCGGILGKGLVRAKDTPNFIANRIGTFAMMRTLGEAIAKGYTVEEVDMVFGPATGRPRAPCSGPPTSSAWTRSCT
jgi:hypothetical protein